MATLELIKSSIVPVKTAPLVRALGLVGFAAGELVGISYTYTYAGGTGHGAAFYAVGFGAVFATLGCLFAQASGASASRLVCVLYGTACGFLIAVIVQDGALTLLDRGVYFASVHQWTFVLRDVGPFIGFAVGIAARASLTGMGERSARAIRHTTIIATVAMLVMVGMLENRANWHLDPPAWLLKYRVTFVAGVVICCTCVAAVAAGIRSAAGPGFQMANVSQPRESLPVIALKPNYLKWLRNVVAVTATVLFLRVAVKWFPTEYQSPHHTASAAVFRANPAPTIPRARKPASGITPSVSTRAAQVVARHLAAIGDVRSRLAIKTRVSVGSATGPGVGSPVPVRIVQAAPDQMLFTATYPTGVYQRGINGAACWEIALDGRLRTIPPAEVRLIRISAGMFLEPDAHDTFDTVEVTGRKTIGAQVCDEVSFKTLDGDVVRRYYGVSSGLLQSIMMMFPIDGKSTPFVVMYDDYRSVGGVLVPFKVTESLGSAVTQVTFTSVQHNVDVAKALSIPDAVRISR